MKVKMITLGCKVNQYESEAMLSSLLKNGFTAAADDEQADVVVLNSCTVTAESDRKVRQIFRRAKKDNPDAVMVLSGCMAQAFPEDAQRLEEADIILGTSNRARLLPDLLTFLSTRQRIVDIEPHTNGETFERLQVENFSGRTRAFVKIEDGCNRFCSYCIIPYARGRVRSKPLEDLKAELHALSDNGFREVVLTGINLSAYGQEFGLHLCDAIEAACAVPGIARVRLGSLEPEQLSEPVIRRMAKQEKLCPQFHLSLQSGCDATLRRMNRHYTADEYRTIVRNLRAAFDNAAITTDIMVGFAGETEEEFAASLAFAREIAFAKVHVFAYSRRPGTRAYDMGDQVTNAVKESRSHAMIRATTETQRAFFDTQVGRTEQVLFERAVQPGVYEGYSMNYTPVLAASGTSLAGQIRTVRIESNAGTHCIGRITDGNEADAHAD
ncbi:MAG: tRNA (N(6)-L-threonylcarbamoyladenosine(37)-C(2))-methylthiotransferase MtaB [Acutalibacteraceae bacterium]|nr:tRNA (N(6)-L-threonylcarbamoyladenosine(37)-C(2))-methylthiotransferase MtaB [Acutalibacteraceae bacterium]